MEAKCTIYKTSNVLPKDWLNYNSQTLLTYI